MPKLYVIAGHGAGDPGACSGGFSEAERVRALAERIKALGGDQVEILDTSRNWYADNGISRLTIPNGSCLLELHMDSASASAKGGHVIVKAGLGTDAYDRALAAFISSMFPGRAKTIVERSDLANPNRAALRGINYRLLECCFISNDGDRAKFNSEMDALAKGILESFGIGVASNNATEVEPAARRIQMYHANGTDAQRFKIRKIGKDVYELVNVRFNRALDVQGAGKTSGTPVQAYTPNDTVAQRWKVIPLPGNYEPESVRPVEIAPMTNPDLRLDVKSASTEEGAELQIYTRNGTPAQQWYIFDNGDGVWELLNNGNGAKLAIDLPW